MTRDSRIWTLMIIAAVLANLSSSFGLLHEAFPWMTPAHDARIELASMLIGTLAGVLRMSPLPISPRGRARQIQKQNDRDYVQQRPTW